MSIRTVDNPFGYYDTYYADGIKDRARQMGLSFVSLYAAAKQLVDNYPKRFPYLEYNVKQIELLNLAPKLDNGKLKK